MPARQPARCRRYYVCSNKAVSTTAPSAVDEKTSTQETFSLRERLLVWLITWVGYLAIRLIAPTLRYTVSVEEGGPPEGNVHPGIYVFWHRCVFTATYHFRNRGIVVMTSRSLDGEYIARFIQRFGYGTARGSSTRGATGAVVEMVRLMRAGCPAGFTIDGPKGPRYVAKMGAVLLAKKTGNPVLPFTIAAERFWEARKCWDRFQIPKPFTRVRVIIAPPIDVPPDADEVRLNAKRDELQAALDGLDRSGREKYSR